MIQLTSKGYESYLNQTNCRIFKKKFEDKCSTDKNYRKVRNHCHYRSKYIGAAHDICNLKYCIPKKKLL